MAARRVRLDGGVGFGFDVTRLYHTGRSVPEASTFHRVAAGTEPHHDAVAVGHVLADALR